MRFANTQKQGLILNDKTIIPGVEEQQLDEFEQLVIDISKEKKE